MNIVLFSKEPSVLEHWQEKLSNIDTSRYSEVFSCSTFKDLGAAIAFEDHLLVYHLLGGVEEEKICYQFIGKYQQQYKMLVLVNTPDKTQGLRLFRAGVHGYSNTFLDGNKLLVALDVIEQGKVWMGAEILNYLLEDCGLKSAKKNELSDNNISADNTQSDKEEVQSEKPIQTDGSLPAEKDDSVMGALLKGIKKLFG